MSPKELFGSIERGWEKRNAYRALFRFPYYLADGLIDALVDSPGKANRGLCAWTAHQSVQEEASISSAGILIRVFYGSGQGDAGWHSFTKYIHVFCPAGQQQSCCSILLPAELVVTFFAID